MPVKALDKKKPVLRVMPLERPITVQRDVYAETSQALFNAYNMIDHMLNKNMTSVCNNIKPESVNDILKLANAMSSLQRTAIELERWQYQKNGTLNEAIDHVWSRLQRDLESQHPEVLAEVVKLLHKYGARDPLRLECEISPRVHLAAALDDDEDTD